MMIQSCKAYRCYSTGSSQLRWIKQRECCCLTPDRADRRTPDTVAAVQLQMTDWDAFQLRELAARSRSTLITVHAESQSRPGVAG